MIPLLVQPGADIPLHLESKKHLDFTQPASYTQGFRQLLQDIRGNAGVVLKPEYRATRVIYVTAPPVVAN